MTRFFLTLVLFLTFNAHAGPYAQQANENPFLDGQLNPKYAGELTALSGDIVDIRDNSKGNPLYLLDLNIDGIDPIWVTGIVPFAKGEISTQSQLIFKGYIATTRDIEPSGELEKLIKSKTLLLVLKAERVK